MEFFSKLGVDGRLLLAQAANFLLVLWLLKRFVYPVILDFIENRRKEIEKGLKFKEEVEKELSRVKTQREKYLNAAAKEADEILIKAKFLAEEKKEKIENLAVEKAEEVLMKAKGRAEDLRQEALVKTKEEIARLAFVVAEKIISGKTKSFDENEALKKIEEILQKTYVGGK